MQTKQRQQTRLFLIQVQTSNKYMLLLFEQGLILSIWYLTVKALYQIWLLFKKKTIQLKIE